MSKFKEFILNIKPGDKYYGNYAKGLKKFYQDPVSAYKRSIAKREKLIEKYERLIKKHKKSIEWLNLLIKYYEEQ